MKNQSVNVHIYITSKSIQQISAELIEKLNQVAGVGSVNINRNIKKLLDIRYDPENMSGTRLVKVIKQEGHSSFLVGM